MSIAWYRPTALPIDPFGTPDRGYQTFRVTSPFGERDDPLNPGRTVFHGGLDIGNARLGDDVVAVADGRVEAVGPLKLPWSQPSTQWPSGNYGGLMVVIAHSGTHVSLYAHLRVITVHVDQRVQAGDKIGEVGDTGSAQGHGHLHFGISNHNATEIKQRGGLLPNAWCIDPWPKIEAAATGEDPAVIEQLEADLALCRQRRAAYVERTQRQVAALQASIDQLTALGIPELQAIIAEQQAKLDEIAAIAADEVQP